MRDSSTNRPRPYPPALFVLAAGIGLTFAALAIVLSLFATVGPTGLSPIGTAFSDRPLADTASVADFATLHDGQLPSLATQTRDATLAMTAILVFSSVFVLVPSGLSLTRHLRCTHHALMREQRALVRLRSEMAHLMESALHDEPTGLPNGAGFRATLDRWLAVQGDPISLLVVRVLPGDGRDQLTDAGLVSIASTLRDGLDGTSVLARLSQTDFAVLTRKAPDRTASRILRILDQPFRHDRMTLRPQVRIGLAVQRTGETIDLLEAAKSALRRAHARPLDPVVCYTDAIRDHDRTVAQLTRDLPSALVDGQITASFQPQICLRSGRLTGVEALARWQHPRFGELPPGQFFPVVQAAGLSAELDRQVWSHALRQMTHWRAQDLSIPQLALNASVETVSDPDILRLLLAQLAGLGLTPSDIAIEVPGSIFGATAGPDAALNIERLMAAGIRVELDGLGCDLSTVINLPERGLSGVKLDRALSEGDHSSRQARSVRAMMSLLHELQIPASAKGVETDVQSRRMKDAGCVRMQGHLVSAPMDARNFRRWIAAGAPATGQIPQPAE